MKQRKGRRWLPYLLTGLLLAAGLLVLLYPAISSSVNQKYQMETIADYSDGVATMKAEKIAAELARARQYNAYIKGQGDLPAGVSYWSIMKSASGVMGYLRIPAIAAELPIYHGTDSQVLKAGVGHLETTDLPIGGTGNHSVLTGHTAYPAATLFSNLDKLEPGDVFYLEIYDQTLAYEVEHIAVVVPQETAALKPQAGKDLVTLVTCSPYGINSHRLLVRGRRIPYVPSREVPAETVKEFLSAEYILGLAVLGGTVLLVIIVVIRRVRRRRRDRAGVVRQ